VTFLARHYRKPQHREAAPQLSPAAQPRKSVERHRRNLHRNTKQSHCILESLIRLRYLAFCSAALYGFICVAVVKVTIPLSSEILIRLRIVICSAALCGVSCAALSKATASRSSPAAQPRKSVERHRRPALSFTASYNTTQDVYRPQIEPL
jgi:predicted transcriptional regulator